MGPDSLLGSKCIGRIYQAARVSSFRNQAWRSLEAVVEKFSCFQRSPDQEASPRQCAFWFGDQRFSEAPVLPAFGCPAVGALEPTLVWLALTLPWVQCLGLSSGLGWTWQPALPEMTQHPTWTQFQDLPQLPAACPTGPGLDHRGPGFSEKDRTADQRQLCQKFYKMQVQASLSHGLHVSCPHGLILPNSMLPRWIAFISDWSVCFPSDPPRSLLGMGLEKRGREPLRLGPG